MTVNGPEDLKIKFRIQTYKTVDSYLKFLEKIHEQD